MRNINHAREPPQGKEGTEQNVCGDMQRNRGSQLGHTLNSERKFKLS